MPRYAITTNFAPEEIDKIEQACKIKGCSKYKLLREATISLSEAIVEGEKENERRKENDSGAKEGRQGPVKVGY